jgi:O-antigen/teichoic acid export membrane protein
MVIWRTAGARRVTSVRGTLRESSAVIFAWIAIAMLTYYDSILARHVLSADQSGYYNAASLAGRALMTALAFVPTILLPKVAARKVAGVASQALGRTALAVTASVSLGAVVAFAVFPALIVKVIAGPQFLLAATLVPWYGVAAACLSLAGVIVAQRLGDEESGIGLAILFAAIAEVLVLTIFHGSAKIIVLEVLFGHALTLLVAMSFRNKREMGASSG